MKRINKANGSADKGRRKFLKAGAVALGLAFLGGLGKMFMDLANPKEETVSTNNHNQTPKLYSFEQASKSGDFQPYFDAVLQDKPLMKELCLDRVGQIIWDADKSKVRGALKKGLDENPSKSLYYQSLMSRVQTPTLVATFVESNDYPNMYVFGYAAKNVGNESEMKVVLQHEGLHMTSGVGNLFQEPTNESIKADEMRFVADIGELYTYSLSLDYIRKLGDVSNRFENEIQKSFANHYKSAITSAKKIAGDKRYSPTHREAAKQLIESQSYLAKGEDFLMVFATENIGVCMIQLRSSYLTSSTK